MLDHSKESLVKLFFESNPKNLISQTNVSLVFREMDLDRIVDE